MKTLKKLAALVLVLALAFSFTACSDAGKLAGTWEHEALYSGEIIDSMGGKEFFFPECYTFSKDGTVTAEVTEEALAALKDAIWNDIWNQLQLVAERNMTNFAEMFGVSLDELLSIMGHSSAVDLYCELESIDLAEFESKTRDVVTYEAKSGTWELTEDGSLVITFAGEEPLTVNYAFADRNTLELYHDGEDVAYTTFTRVK